MRIDHVHGVLGGTDATVDLRPGPGVVALLGDARARQAAQSLLVGAVSGVGRIRRRLIRDARVRLTLANGGPTVDLDPRRERDDDRDRLLATLGIEPVGLSLLWAGGLTEDLTTTLAGAARLVATTAGLSRVEGALAALATRPGVGEALRALDQQPGRSRESDGTAEVEEAGAARLARVEHELQNLRADAVEIQGDLDEATMEWLRERQDAETTLLAYRDRARELRVRLREMEDGGRGAACPTCGRVLDEHFEAVAGELRDEWESVVQDGQWWKRRRNQLEPKPERVRELERRAVRSQAAIEEAAERAEHLRTALGGHLASGELAPAPAREPDPELLQAIRDVRDPAATARSLSRLAQRLLQQAHVTLLSATSHMLNRLSGGRLVGLEVQEDAPDTLVPSPVIGGPGPEDFAAARVSAHLALARLVGGRIAVGSLLLGEVFAQLDEEDQLRAVARLRRMRGRFPQILVMPGSAVVDAVPEAFDEVWEFRATLDAQQALRALPVGVGTIVVAS